MKKFNIIIVMVLCVMALTACQKEGLVTLDAYISNYSSEGGSKMYIDNDNKTYWSTSNDNARVNNATYAITVDGETGQGSISGVESAANYTVVYPASITGGADITGASNINITLPTVQNYSVNNNKQQLEAPMLAYSDGDSRLTFTNLCSLLKVTVSNTTGSTITMKSIKVSGANLCGTGTISNVTTSPTLTMAGGAGDTLVTLDFSNTETTINTGNTASYYIILPKDETGHKLTININAINNTDNYSIIARSTNTLTVAAGLLYNGPTLAPTSADFLGAGSEGNPYLINHSEDIITLRTILNNNTYSSHNYFTDNYFILTTNINCGDLTVITAAYAYFEGTFNGNGNTITYTLNCSNNSKQGLFNAIRSNAKITNLNVNCTISGTNTTYGGIAGSMEDYAEISNCTVTGSISGSSTYYGGIVGYMDEYGTITDCYSSANITSTATKSYTGGIAGFMRASTNNSSTITYCSASGTITSAQSANGYMGGIVGACTNVSTKAAITNCCFTGSLSGPTTYLGMINGYYYYFNTTDCYYRASTSNGIKGGGNYSTGTDNYGTSPKTDDELTAYANGLTSSHPIYANGILSSL